MLVNQILSLDENLSNTYLKWKILEHKCNIKTSKTKQNPKTHSARIRRSYIYFRPATRHKESRLFHNILHYFIFLKITVNVIAIELSVQLKYNQRLRKKWNESGFRPFLCTYRLNWARRTSWGWWYHWDDTVLQTQDSKFKDYVQ